MIPKDEDDHTERTERGELDLPFRYPNLWSGARATESITDEVDNKSYFARRKI